MMFERLDRFLIDKRMPLGRGQFGVVYIGYIYPGSFQQLSRDSRPDVEVVAVKVLPLKGSTAEEQELRKKFAKVEIENLSKLSHPNIVRFIDAKFHKGQIYLFMEYCEGSLEQLLLERRLSEEEVLSLFGQVVAAFRHAITNHIFHRDIKPENILLHDRVIKVTDYGVSNRSEKGEFATLCGTPIFSAPEVLNLQEGQTYGEGSDVWSLGLILYYMLYIDRGQANLSDRLRKSLPWYGKNAIQLANSIAENQKFVFPDKPRVSETTKELIRSMLVADPRRRITFPQLFAHPYFQCQSAPSLTRPAVGSLECSQFEMLELKDLTIQIESALNGLSIRGVRKVQERERKVVKSKAKILMRCRQLLSHVKSPEAVELRSKLAFNALGLLRDKRDQDQESIELAEAIRSQVNSTVRELEDLGIDPINVQSKSLMQSGRAFLQKKEFGEWLQQECGGKSNGAGQFADCLLLVLGMQTAVTASTCDRAVLYLRESQREQFRLGLLRRAIAGLRRMKVSIGGD